MSVSEICHWLQGICRSKIGVKSDMINASAAEWQINLTAATIEDTLEICSNFFKTWNVILDHLQAHQHYPSSPFQLLKFLFHELIIDELETGINEKLAYQVIFQIFSAKIPDSFLLKENQFDEKNQTFFRKNEFGIFAPKIRKIT